LTDFEEGTDAGLRVFRPRARSNSPPGERAFNGAFAAWGSKASVPPLLRPVQPHPARHGAASL